MSGQTTATVISVAKQWWLKVNTKPVRKHLMDGAIFPHIIKVQYEVNGSTYTKRKWIKAGHPVPAIGSALVIHYREDNPKKARVL